MRKRSTQRGVALITVILVLLVLTVIGLAASTMMTQEDRTAARMELQKTAFYAAEAGLRRGEEVLNDMRLAQSTLLLQHQASVTPYGIRTEHIRHPVAGTLTTWDVTHLGTPMCSEVVLGGSGGATCQGVVLVDQVLPVAVVGLDSGRVARYSLFVRNNPEDSRPPGSVTVNADSRIRLLSVGVITSAEGRPLAVKILEEEYDFGRITQAPSVQKLGDSGGTSSGEFG